MTGVGVVEERAIGTVRGGPSDGYHRYAEREDAKGERQGLDGRRGCRQVNQKDIEEEQVERGEERSAGGAGESAVPDAQQPWKAVALDGVGVASRKQEQADRRQFRRSRLEAKQGASVKERDQGEQAQRRAEQERRRRQRVGHETLPEQSTEDEQGTREEADREADIIKEPGHRIGHTAGGNRQHVGHESSDDEDAQDAPAGSPETEQPAGWPHERSAGMEEDRAQGQDTTEHEDERPGARGGGGRRYREDQANGENWCGQRDGGARAAPANQD